jgi:ribosomal protein S18 acetylase RimI-like enzyme
MATSPPAWFSNIAKAHEDAMTASGFTDPDIHVLGIADVERVVAIDRAHSGHARRGYFEKRFAAAAAQPDDYIHLGAMRGGSLRGFVIARILRGEFGQQHAVAVLDSIGVEAESQERGIGQALMRALRQTMQRRGVHRLQSQAAWSNHSLLRFFDAAGFALAPRLALERSTLEPLQEANEEV